MKEFDRRVAREASQILPPYVGFEHAVVLRSTKSGADPGVHRSLKRRPSLGRSSRNTPGLHGPREQAREANQQLVQRSTEQARERFTNAKIILKEEVDKLCAPPSTYGVYLAANEDSTVTILQGRR
jgi:hypothetical protein